MKRLILFNIIVLLTVLRIVYTYSTTPFPDDGAINPGNQIGNFIISIPIDLNNYWAWAAAHPVFTIQNRYKVPAWFTAALDWEEDMW